MGKPYQSRLDKRSYHRTRNSWKKIKRISRRYATSVNLYIGVDVSSKPDVVYGRLFPNKADCKIVDWIFPRETFKPGHIAIFAIKGHSPRRSNFLLAEGFHHDS